MWPMGEVTTAEARARVACGDSRIGEMARSGYFLLFARNEVCERGTKVGARKAKEAIDMALREEGSSLQDYLHAAQRVSWSAA